MESEPEPRTLKRRLTKHGKRLALVIDRPILQRLGIDERTELTVTTDGRSLVVTPVTADGDERDFEAALDHVSRRHAKALRRLAHR